MAIGAASSSSASRPSAANLSIDHESKTDPIDAAAVAPAVSAAGCGVADRDQVDRVLAPGGRRLDAVFGVQLVADLQPV